MHLPNEHGIWCRRLPSQIMEAALAIILLIASIGLRMKFPHDGMLFLSALIGYGLGRWWLESTRESIDRIGSFNLHRAISVVLVAASVISVLFLWLYQAWRLQF